MSEKTIRVATWPISRATENGIYLVMANTPANPNDMHAPGSSHGNSKIIDPDGNVGKEAGFLGGIASPVQLSIYLRQKE